MKRQIDRRDILPRYIKPEQIILGDTIRISYPESGGIKVAKEGTVAVREDHGKSRFLLTAEGGQLLVWEPGAPKLRITLLARNPHADDKMDGALFDFTDGTMSQVRARVAN